MSGYLVFQSVRAPMTERGGQRDGAVIDEQGIRALGLALRAVFAQWTAERAVMQNAGQTGDE